MRFRKIAGLSAGTLVAGVLMAPGLTGAAHAAPSTATLTGNYECSATFGSFTILSAYQPGLAVTADGTAVTATSSSLGALTNADTGASLAAGFKIEEIVFNVGATVGDESVALTGTTTYAAQAGVSTSDPIVLPGLSATRTGTADIASGTINSVSGSLKLRVPYGPPGGTTAVVPMSCDEPVETTVKQALDCTFGAYTIKFPAIFQTRVVGTRASAEVETTFTPGMPAFVTVASFDATAALNVDGEAVNVSGTTSYDPPQAGNTPFVVPALKGTRTATAAAESVKVTGATLTFEAMGTDNVVNCVAAAWPVTITGAATSPSANKVDLSATVTPADAVGNVEFFDGATKVATAAVAEGAASASLTGVAAGAKTYTAKFVPTDAAAFAGVTSSAISVVVKSAPVVAQATKTTAKVKVNNKAKTAVITVTVTNKANGKAKIAVTGAGTKVTKTVTVKNGKATLKLTKKQLKKKGKRTVSVSFAANAKFKASKGKTTFKIK